MKLAREPVGGEKLGPLRAMTATSAGLSLVFNIVEYPIMLSRYLIGGLPSVLVILTPRIPILFSGKDLKLNRPQHLEGLFDILKLFEKGMVLYIYIIF
jgi:hypothetical protein